MDTEYLNNRTMSEAKEKKVGLELEQPTSNMERCLPDRLSCCVCQTLCFSWIQLGYSLFHGAARDIERIMYANFLQKIGHQ